MMNFFTMEQLTFTTRNKHPQTYIQCDSHHETKVEYQDSSCAQSSVPFKWPEEPPC